jgi:hypothetical protein
VTDKLAEKSNWSSFRDGNLTLIRQRYGVFSHSKSTFRALVLCDIEGA